VASTDIGVSPRVQLREMRIKAHVDETDSIVFLQSAPRFLQQMQANGPGPEVGLGEITMISSKPV
jgi:hypothetical protein